MQKCSGNRVGGLRNVGMSCVLSAAPSECAEADRVRHLISDYHSLASCSSFAELFFHLHNKATMGQDISVSSLVDELYAVAPEERRAALESLLQHVSIRSSHRLVNYLAYCSVKGASTEDLPPRRVRSQLSSAVLLPQLPPALTTGTTQTKPGVQKNANIFTAAAQFRVEKTQAKPIRRLQELRGNHRLRVDLLYFHHK